MQPMLSDMTEDEKRGFLHGLEKASELVFDHWNDSVTMVNQKQQAIRSAEAIQHYRQQIQKLLSKTR